YGALVFDGVPDWDACPQVPLLVPAPGVPAEVLRRYADGRSSFVVVTPEGITGLATFEHSVEDEGAAVRMQRSGAVIVQRTRRGAVRVCAGHGVIVWNGSRWMFKPRAEDYVRALRRLAPHADPAVLTGLLELAVHSLASARVGATFVWNVDGRPPDDPRRGLVELGRAIARPPGPFPGAGVGGVSGRPGHRGGGRRLGRADRRPARPLPPGRRGGAPHRRGAPHLGPSLHLRRRRGAGGGGVGVGPRDGLLRWGGGGRDQPVAGRRRFERRIRRGALDGRQRDGDVRPVSAAAAGAGRRRRTPARRLGRRLSGVRAADRHRPRPDHPRRAGPAGLMFLTGSAAEN